MGIFSRIGDVLKANINDMIDRAEDPEKMVKQIILDLQKEVSKATQALGKAMAEGEKISISGFGTFEVRERAERQGINPRTREPITIAASRSIVFKPGKSLKDTL